ncbi:hypothetical protein JAAARDRAFT_128204 [Jaapia argillacea MUCL 33604]|uniref:Small RNA 2'-O-methyltransferase n=1 Tax=Jaapia argillacea MUCL 33604 TaxID=933084 RepID=A0A067PX90_9AGAM|nr:hypothetical protein JAAARDRAFT_128204 [Jaapia argillacea MUCL 33604]
MPGDFVVPEIGIPSVSNDYHEAAQEPKVSFFPPLFLQRRIWVLDQMRKYHVTSILDIGCGEGSLLACLARPAPWLPPPAPLPPTDPAESTQCPSSQFLVPSQDPLDLYPSFIAGLDISPSDLQYAIEDTSPAAHESSSNIRWEPLEVQIWEGGLECVNEAFVDMECIVAMEVIEHLEPSVFNSFAPTLLGTYHPQLLLMTTPSYNFNARFINPITQIRVGGFPDPTYRTNRIFRHLDHKFEWTVAEFTEWCEEVGKEWGYEVEIGCIGIPLEKDWWGRDEELGSASQVVAFQRMEGDEWIEKRKEKERDFRGGEEGEQRSRHTMLARHHHVAHPQAGKPGSILDIGAAVKTKMEELCEAVMRVEQLWFEHDLAVLCGGWFEFLVAGIESNEGLQLRRDGKLKREEWEVLLVGGVPEREGLWDGTDDQHQDDDDDENENPGSSGNEWFETASDIQNELPGNGWGNCDIAVSNDGGWGSLPDLASASGGWGAGDGWEIGGGWGTNTDYRDSWVSDDHSGP